MEAYQRPHFGILRVAGNPWRESYRHPHGLAGIECPHAVLPDQPNELLVPTCLTPAFRGKDSDNFRSFPPPPPPWKELDEKKAKNREVENNSTFQTLEIPDSSWLLPSSRLIAPHYSLKLQHQQHRWKDTQVPFFFSSSPFLRKIESCELIKSLIIWYYELLIFYFEMKLN